MQAWFEYLTTSLYCSPQPRSPFADSRSGQGPRHNILTKDECDRVLPSPMPGLYLANCQASVAAVVRLRGRSSPKRPHLLTLTVNMIPTLWLTPPSWCESRRLIPCPPKHTASCPLYLTCTFLSRPSSSCGKVPRDRGGCPEDHCPPPCAPPPLLLSLSCFAREPCV